ncbi:MAG: metallophosphoesterase [Pseudomonadota bacterium]
MKIQIISDVHLEFGSFELPDKDCDVLIAAGDIGVGLEGLDWLLTLDMPVVYIAGNHEYWGYDMQDLQDDLVDVSKGSNVRFLENKAAIIKGVRFLGCTLWTDFDNCDDEEMMEDLQHIMNDFRYISFNKTLITPGNLIDINRVSVEWLRRELAKSHDGPTVVVTHHAPSKKSWVADPDDYLKFAYCNKLEPLLKENDIDLWVHGHIHHTSDYIKNGTRVICNPRGYKGYQIVDNFDASKLYNV